VAAAIVGCASANAAVSGLAPVELGSQPRRAAVPVKLTSTTAVPATISIGWARFFEALAMGMFILFSFL
jgi:hypothetical protein